MAKVGSTEDVAPASNLDADDALTGLFRREHTALVRLAVALVGDQGAAEDIVQNAYVALYRRWHVLDDPDAAVGYLRVSVVNGARSRHRRRALWARLPAYLGRDWAPAAEDAVLRAEEHRPVLAAVRALPPRQQQVVVLRYWFDMSERQIAEALGVSAGTVKSSASRALTAIERMLGEA